MNFTCLLMMVNVGSCKERAAVVTDIEVSKIQIERTDCYTDRAGSSCIYMFFTFTEKKRSTKSGKCAVSSVTEWYTP